MTRQGKGSFVAETADLRSRVQRGELDGHLTSAIEVGRQLGLSPAQIESRLRDLLDEKAPDAPTKEESQRGLSM